MSRALAYPVNNKASMLFSIELLGCMDLKFLHYAQMTAVSYTIFVRRILGTGGPGASAQVFSDLGGSSLVFANTPDRRFEHHWGCYIAKDFEDR